MLSNDLLCYSIMSNGEKAVTYPVPQYAPLPAKQNKLSLPPLTSYVSLTENNLNSLTSYLHTQQLHKHSSLGSTPPSLTSSSSASESPLGSPRIAHSASNSSLFTLPSQVQVHVSEQNLGLSPEKKRRQRLGPSCDNCRTRKVKCNADVFMISRHFTGGSASKSDDDDAEEYEALSAADKARVLAGESVQIGSNYVLVLFNQKLIKFKPCMSCVSKGFPCCFSKGFTKEDILSSKRKTGEEADAEPKPASPAKAQKKSLSEGSPCSHKISKLATRKSSCGACRKRKVKCVVTSAHGQCVGCAKKDIACSF